MLPNPYLQPLKFLSSRLDRLVEGRLWLKVLIALGLGILLGLFLGPDLAFFKPAVVETITSWLALPGQLFLALIQMVVVPLVIASIIKGLASNNNPEALKKIGLIALVFMVFTTIAATAIGIGLAEILRPGGYIPAEGITDLGHAAATQTHNTQLPSLAQIPDKAMSLLPKNPLASMVSGEMLQVILFAAVLGVAMLSIPAEQAQPLFDLFGALQDVSIRVVSWAMRLAPLAVFGLITQLVATVGVNVLAGMAIYVLTVVLGLFCLALLYLLIVKVAGSHSATTLLHHCKELLLLAFSTSSSAAVMPLSLQITENNLIIRPGIARFLIPLGATVNMAGTALYQGAATVFLAQVFQVDLDLTSYVFIITMAVAASIGSPATPGAGIIILSMVLEGVGIPAAGIALLLGVDRILDMCRTAVNVLGDVVLCSVAEKWLAVDDEDSSAVASEPAGA